MPQYYLDDAEFGRIIITQRSTARSYIARWKDGALHLTIPPNATASSINSTLESMRARIRTRKKAPLQYSFGQTIKCFAHTITIGTHNGRKNAIGFGGKERELYINLHPSVDITADNITRTISSSLEKLMAERAEDTLIPYAKMIAIKLGVTGIKRFEIGRGKRKLGHCTAQKVIQLSRNLMFMPGELVEYIVCHELAHLTHMNHSAAFHALCNRYCGGREAELERMLKKFSMPILK